MRGKRKCSSFGTVTWDRPMEWRPWHWCHPWCWGSHFSSTALVHLTFCMLQVCGEIWCQVVRTKPLQELHSTLVSITDDEHRWSGNLSKEYIWNVTEMSLKVSLFKIVKLLSSHIISQWHSDTCQGHHTASDHDGEQRAPTPKGELAGNVEVS